MKQIRRVFEDNLWIIENYPFIIIKYPHLFHLRTGGKRYIWNISVSLINIVVKPRKIFWLIPSHICQLYVNISKSENDLTLSHLSAHVLNWLLHALVNHLLREKPEDHTKIFKW